MRLLIDNADGLGPTDYSLSAVTTEPVTIQRRHDEVTELTALLDLSGAGLPMPAARARVSAQSATGTVLFSGYLVHAESVIEEMGPAPFRGTRLLAAEERWLTGAAVDTALQPAESTTHTISLAENIVLFTKEPSTLLRELANDVSLSGEHEPTTFATEIFHGDGTTATFVLSTPPFRSPGLSTVLLDDFATPSLDARRWTLADPSRSIAPGRGGLVVAGGNGLDVQTVLRFANLIEMGGTLVAQASGVFLQPGSDGVLLGFYDGAVASADCFAGFRVKSAAGAQTIVAIVHGAETGTAFTFAAGHRYTLCLRLFCAEWQRVMGSYQVLSSGRVQTFGGGLVDAPMQVVFEITDEGLASNTIATVLYDGAIAVSPAQCTFAPVNAVQMQCTLGSVAVHQTSPVRVVSTRSDGTTYTRRRGAAGEGADFSLTSQGGLTFFPGVVPQPGELLTVSYRRSSRAVARLQDADAVTAERQGGLPGLPSRAGHMLHPGARSSADCAAGAAALLRFAGDPSALLTGHCDLVNALQSSDVLPGDVLSVSDGVSTRSLPVWSVSVVDGNSVPEVLRYRVDFAQSEAKCLSFRVGAALAADVPMPVLPGTGAAPALASLAGLMVVSATTSALQVDAGVDPPVGGGFEVRSTDGGFGPGGGSGLVLRSPVRGFSLPRTAFAERFFIRMYDGSAQPRYSAWSSAVFTHLPVA